jgi:hypothetical protein
MGPLTAEPLRCSRATLSALLAAGRLPAPANVRIRSLLSICGIGRAGYAKPQINRKGVRIDDAWVV